MIPAETYEGLTAEQKNLSNRPHNPLHGIMTDLIMTCRGSNCPYVAMCDLKNAYDEASVIPDEAIVGIPCVFEVAKTRALFEAFKMVLLEDAEEYQINAADILSLIEIIRVELQQSRIDKRLAIEGDVIDSDIMLTEFGPVTQKQAHPLVEFANKLARRRDAAMKMLMADRASKTKVGKKAPIDPSKYYAELRKKAEGAKIKRAKRTIEVVLEEEIDSDDVENVILP